MAYTLAELNSMTQAEFVNALAGVFEDTPGIAYVVWRQRPFRDLSDLYEKLVAVVQTMSVDEQLDLLQAHPDLGSRAKMADASVQEQASVGLDRLTSAESDRFQQLNQSYKTRFGFPFIIAVKNHTKDSILEAFEQRLENSQEAEMAQALTEVAKIARLRLADRISSGNKVI